MPGRAIPLVVSTPDRVADAPFVAVVAPVYVMAVGSGETTKLLEPLLAKRTGETEVSPPKAPVSGYVP